MKIYNLLLFLSILLGLCACTKEELEVVDQPIPINENSPTYQSYLAERALSFIKVYRFDQVQAILDRITDELIKNEIMVTYNEYKTRAESEALYFVNLENDTLYFLVPSETEPDRTTRTRMYINNEITNIPKTKGVLSGLRKFPKLQSFIAQYTLDEGVDDLKYLPDLEIFNWSRDEAFYTRHFPNEVYTPAKLVADFSKNSHLKTITLGDVDIQDIIFPETEIDELIVTGLISRYNSNDVLNTVKAKTVSIMGQSGRNKFIFNGKGIKVLKLSTTYDVSFGFTTIDISESALQELILSHGGSFITELKMNEGLKSLSFSTEGLPQKPEFPVSLEELSLTNYLLRDAKNLDFSALVNLKTFSLSQMQSNNKADLSLLKFPKNLEVLNYIGHGSTNRLDLSYLLKLHSANLTGTNDVVFAPNIVEVNMQYISGVLDLSGLKNLKRIKIYAAPSFGILNEIIFPPNLNENEVNDIENNFYTNISIPRDCKLTNMPEWMNKYIYYN